MILQEVEVGSLNVETNEGRSSPLLRLACRSQLLKHIQTLDLALCILASHYPRYDPALRHHKFTLVCRLNPEVKAAQNNPCFSPIDPRQLHENFVDGISVVPRPSGNCDHNVKRDSYQSNILAAASVRLDPQC
jgi:hypothetical protein